MAVESIKPAGRWTKWIKEGLLLLGMVALSAAIAFLLFQFRDIFSISLQSYGWLAYLVVFFVSLLSSCTIFIPTPGAAIMFAAAAIWDPVLVGFASGTGDAIGEMTSYWVGYAGEKIIVDEQMPAYRSAVRWMDRFGVWAVFGVALVPVVPFDLIGLAAGALKIRWWKFLLAAWCGKVPRAIVLCSIGHQLPLILNVWPF